MHRVSISTLEVNVVMPKCDKCGDEFRDLQECDFCDKYFCSAALRGSYGMGTKTLRISIRRGPVLEKEDITARLDPSIRLGALPEA